MSDDTNWPSWLRPHGVPWTRGPERVVYDNPWIRITEHQATAPTGQPATYGLVGFKNLAIAVLPLHDDGTITLVGQHRFPLADYSWEIPEGGSPVEADPLEGARRELLEETGLVVEVGPVIEVFDRIIRDQDGRVQFHYVLVDYVCRPVGGALAANSDVADAVWAAPADLPAFNLADPATPVILRGLTLAGF